jgi:sec-independent protein translocase protein TatB
MFSIPHLAIIFVVVLVVFGPEKLPELARNLGKILGEFRRATGDLQNQFEGHLRDIERESSLRQTATAAGTTIAPPVKDTAAQSQPKADSASAPGTVPGEAPHGWTVAPANASASENGGTVAATSAETPGATQADTAHVQPDATEAAQAPSGSSQMEQPGTGQSSAAAAAEPGHEKGSDGGIPN